jgi:alpha-mannosidase
VNGNLIENQFLRLSIANRGAITSWLDKTQNNREIVRSINGRAINDLGNGSGSLQIENTGPVSVTIKATSQQPLAHVTRITLFRDSYRVEIQNEIIQNFNDTHTWGFGFNLQNHSIWHEEVGAVILAKLTTNGGHYSPRNARYDWLTINHFADIGDQNFGIVLSNWDCYFMKIGESYDSTVGDGLLDTTIPSISVMVGGREGGEKRANTGIKNQGGDNYFLQRFALSTRRSFNPPESMKFSLAHQNPLVAGWISGGSDYPENTYSFISISNPKVILWALKPADDGIQNGAIARFWNLSQNQESFALNLSSGPLTSIVQTTHLETPIENLPPQNGVLVDNLNPQQLKTYALSTDVFPKSVPELSVTEEILPSEISQESSNLPESPLVATLTPTNLPKNATTQIIQETHTPEIPANEEKGRGCLLALLRNNTRDRFV